MQYRSLIIAALITALAFASFRWYHTEQALAVCRQDMQAAQRLLALCQPVIECNNHVLFQEAIKYLGAYPTERGKILQDKFRCLDTLFQTGFERNVSNQPKMINTYVDSILAFTEHDSLIRTLLRKTVQDCHFRGEYVDSLLRQQAKLQLSLVQNIAFKYLCVRVPRPDMKFETNYPVLAPLQIEARSGQTFEARILLSNPTPIHYSRVDVTVNGEVCPLVHGMANFQTTFQKSGINELRLKVVTKNLLTGEVHTSIRIVEVLVKA